MNVFEYQYIEKGFESQRKYPNESLLGFLASNYFHLEREERKSIKILELGCGSGANLWMLAKEGFDAYGIDFSQTGLKFCGEMLDSWGVCATLSHGDMTKLSFSDGYFDSIVDVVSMQHLTFEEHLDAYREAYRCLSNGGTFYSYHLGENSISLKSTDEMLDHCTVSNISSGFPLENNGQTCFISANEVRFLLSEVGFKNIVIEKNTRSYSNQVNSLEYLSISAIK